MADMWYFGVYGHKSCPCLDVHYTKINEKLSLSEVGQPETTFSFILNKSDVVV